MAIHTDKISTSKTSSIGDTGAAIQIERRANKAATIRVTYPDDRRRKERKVLKIVCAVLWVAPAVAGFIFHGGSEGWLVVIASAVVATLVTTYGFRQFSALSRSYVFHADHSGLTIETSDGLRQTTQHFTRGQITEISLGFSHYRGPNSMFRCWMVIQTSLHSGGIRCLHDLGGDHLAAIANVLRDALGMPERSWP